MCKLLIIPKIVNTAKTKLFMRAAVPDFTRSDNDGLGYVALNRNGTLSGERWRVPSDAFKPIGESMSEAEKQALDAIAKVIEDYSSEPVYNAFGEDSDDWASVVYHARMATCDKSLPNVHPFINNKATVALAHNGVITHGPKEWTPTQSTCDSEILLKGYQDVQVVESMENFDFVAEYVQGYFALGVLAKQASGKWILDVVKDSRASLQAVYVPELQSVVYCTDAAIVAATCKLLSWECGEAFNFQPDVILRHDAMTGKVLGSYELEGDSDFYVDNEKTLTQDYNEAMDRDYTASDNAAWHEDGAVVSEFLVKDALDWEDLDETRYSHKAIRRVK